MAVISPVEFDDMEGWELAEELGLEQPQAATAATGAVGEEREL
eukprot:SAG11_NODE_5818_length_1457_cov_1.068483_3_plen_43_part_00